MKQDAEKQRKERAVVVKKVVSLTVVKTEQLISDKQVVSMFITDYTAYLFIKKMFFYRKYSFF